MILVALAALILPAVLAARGKAYRGAYGAVAVIALLVGFFIASPWPKGQTPEAQMVSDFFNSWGGDFGLCFMALAIGAILGAMLWRPAKPPTPPSAAQTP